MFSLHRKKNNDNVSSKMTPYSNQHPSMSMIQPAIPMAKHISNAGSQFSTTSNYPRNDSQMFAAVSSPMMVNTDYSNNNNNSNNNTNFYYHANTLDSLNQNQSNNSNIITNNRNISELPNSNQAQITSHQQLLQPQILYNYNHSEEPTDMYTIAQSSNYSDLQNKTLPQSQSHVDQQSQTQSHEEQQSQSHPLSHSEKQSQPQPQPQSQSQSQAQSQSQSQQQHPTFQYIPPKMPQFQQLQQYQGLRRVWVRKNASSATTISVGPNDIVDDLKYMISDKFPTTLARQFDPSDLTIKLIIPQPDIRSTNYVASPNSNSTSNLNIVNNNLGNNLGAPSGTTNAFFNAASKRSLFNEGTNSPVNNSFSRAMQPSSSYSENLRSNSPLSYDSFNNSNSNKAKPLFISTDTNDSLANKYLILEPDVFVWSIIDKYFPNGMTMADAFIVDSDKSLNEELFKCDRLSSPLRNSQQDASHTSFDMNPNHNNKNNSVSRSFKTAIIGDQKVPPPRLKLTNSHDFSTGQTPQSSAVILFPKDVRGDPKLSNQSSIMETIPPSPSPKVKEEKAPPVPLSKGLQQRTNSSELNKKLNLKVNTTTSIDSITSGLQKPVLTSTAIESTPSSSSTSKDFSPKLFTNSKNIEKKTPLNKSTLPDSKEKKQGISKILCHINVLVVEDNLVNQKIMARHLKSCKVQFEIASTGKEALEMWKKGGFHLCFMDIQLPVMSGIEVTKEIRRLERLNHIGNFSGHNTNDGNILNGSDDVLDLSLFRSPIIIVALTASTGATDQQNALAAGCNDYLTKPVQLKWLKNKLTEWGYMQALINYDYFRNEN